VYGRLALVIFCKVSRFLSKDFYINPGFFKIIHYKYLKDIFFNCNNFFKNFLKKENFWGNFLKNFLNNFLKNSLNNFLKHVLKNFVKKFLKKILDKFLKKFLEFLESCGSGFIECTVCTKNIFSSILALFLPMFYCHFSV